MASPQKNLTLQSVQPTRDFFVSAPHYRVKGLRRSLWINCAHNALRRRAICRAAVELQELHYRFNSCLSLFTATVKLDVSRDPRYRAKLEQWMVANLCRRRVEIVLRFVDLN